MIDIIFAVILLVAILKGYRKGFIIAIFSIIAYIVGLAAALKLSATVAEYLKKNMDISGKWLPFLSFAFVFILVVFLVTLGGRLIEKTFEMALLGWLNRLGGILLFVLLYTIIFSIFLFYSEKIHLFDKEAFITSKAYPYLKPLGPGVINQFGKILPAFKDLFNQLENYFDSLPTKTTSTT